VRGFTVVELLVVLTLTGILAVTFAPRFSSGVVELGGQAQQVAADIRYAQTLSMTRGQRYCIFFSSSGYQLRTSNCATAVAHPATGSSAVVSLSGVTFSMTNLPSNYVEFNTKGQPYVSAATSLSANATVTLTSSGSTRNIVISPETGKASVQ
jgi:prepilin-type N-terminal cleavage/methylation domain-containing protein